MSNGDGSRVYLLASCSQQYLRPFKLRSSETQKPSPFLGGGGGLAHDERWKRPNADACSPPIRAPGGGNANLSRDSEVLFDSEFLQLAHDCFFPTSPKIQHAGDVPPPRLSSS